MATFAGRYDEPLLKYVGGRLKPAVDAVVTVYESDGSTVATLYTSRTKATTAANPVSPDGFGNLQFFADPGAYVLSVVDDGEERDTHSITVPYDPDEALDAIEVGASAVPVTDAGGHFAGSTVEAVLQEIGVATYLTAPMTVTYDISGNVETVTVAGATTTYTYNADGTVATEERGGVVRTYSYTDGLVTGVA